MFGSNWTDRCNGVMCLQNRRALLVRDCTGVAAMDEMLRPVVVKSRYEIEPRTLCSV